MSYLGLVGVAVVLVAVPLAVAMRRWAARGTLGVVLVSLGCALVVLCVLTVVFDSVMIDADLFRYGTGTLTGVRLWRAPIEDLGYPLVAVMLLPAVWELLAPPATWKPVASRPQGASRRAAADAAADAGPEPEQVGR